MLSRNILSNIFAKLWTVLVNFAFVPLYIRYLGVEAYGLIGFFAAMQGIFSTMDLGLSTTLNRELASGINQPTGKSSRRDLLRTIEQIYLSVGALIGIAVLISAPSIARFWLHSENLSPESVTSAIRLLGLSIAAQWPISLYSAGLMGLQRQEVNAFLTSAVATVRAVGAMCVLWLVAATIEAYFIWQIVVSVLAVLVGRTVLWASLTPPNSRPSFKFSLVRSTWHFSAGMACITVLGLAFNIGDKLVVSALLPLKTFGYYVLGGMIASAVTFLPVPVFNAIFPRFSQLVSCGDNAQLARLYHRASQLLAVIVWPLAIIVSLFPQELLVVWTGDPEIARQLKWIVPILVMGSGLNAVYHVPYALQLANGWTRLEIVATGVAVCVLGPLLPILIWTYGATGAALVWLAYNAGNVFIVVSIMHKRLLVREKWAWYFADIGRPFVAVTALGIAARVYLPQGMTRMQTLLSIFTVGVAAAAAALAVTSEVRTRIWQELSRMRLAMQAAER